MVLYTSMAMASSMMAPISDPETRTLACAGLHYKDRYRNWHPDIECNQSGKSHRVDRYGRSCHPSEALSLKLLFAVYTPRQTSGTLQRCATGVWRCGRHHSPIRRQLSRPSLDRQSRGEAAQALRARQAHFRFPPLLSVCQKGRSRTDTHTYLAMPIRRNMHRPSQRRIGHAQSTPNHVLIATPYILS